MPRSDRIVVTPLFDLPVPESDPLVANSPVGPVLRVGHGKWGVATATYDTSERYRYRLSHVWGNPPRRRACWIMLNPSTATELATDPTVERTLRFARSWGYGANEVVNLFAYRATDPMALSLQEDPVGTGNDLAILSAAQAADVTIAAWGVHGRLGDRSETVLRMLADARVEFHYLRLTKDGHPSHPLYLPGHLRPKVLGGGVPVA